MTVSVAERNDHKTDTYRDSVETKILVATADRPITRQPERPVRVRLGL